MRTALLIALALFTLSSSAAEGNVAFSIHSATSGNWSDPATWAEKRTPSANDTVQIRRGHTVLYDVATGTPAASTAIRTIHVAGTLRFSRDKSTSLTVGLIKITPGETCSEDGFVCHASASAISAPTPETSPADAPALEIGTAAEPMPADVTATIRLAYFEGMDKETLPAIIACGGRWDVHGAPLSRTWLKLGANAAKGTSTVTLAEAVTGWRAGDKVIITSSSQSYGNSSTFRTRPGKPSTAGTEERTIKNIDGTLVTLDSPLSALHLGQGEYRAEIANLSRNVIIESADPAGVRGHTLFHSAATGGISYAEFRHLGKEGVLGKYAIHFHLIRDGMRGSGVIGASVWDSANRWITIHATDYLLIRDNVGYQSIGHGFFLEDGTEQYNILDRNLAVQAYHGKRLKGQALPFDANEGAGFWWANGRNALTRNVAVENDRYGFKFELRGKSGTFDPISRLRMPDGSMQAVDIRTLPFLRFDTNESHCDGLYAMNFGDETDKTPSVHGDRQHPFIARNLKVWESHYVLRPNLQYFLMDGLDAFAAVYGVYHPDYDAHVYRNIHLNRIVSEPINRGLDDDDEQRGMFTYENLTIENCRTGRDPLIQLSLSSPREGQAGHFRNLVVTNCKSSNNVVDLGGGPRNKHPQNAVAYYFHDYPAAGEVTKVVPSSDRAVSENGAAFQPVKNFTGRDVRAMQVGHVEFPKLLDPIDDLPPATMIRSITRSNGRILVTGITQDNGDLAGVTVNGATAQITSSQAGVSDWRAEIAAPADNAITATAKDSAGNAEATAHRVMLK